MFPKTITCYSSFMSESKRSLLETKVLTLQCHVSFAKIMSMDLHGTGRVPLGFQPLAILNYPKDPLENWFPRKDWWNVNKGIVIFVMRRTVVLTLLVQNAKLI